MPKQLFYQKIKAKKALKKAQGFTLLEVLIVLGIILILSHITFASYQHYVIKAARVTGKSEVLKTATALESYYSQHYTYVGAHLNDLGIPSVTEDGRYRIVLSQLSQSHYLMVAIPQGPQLKDKRCGALMLNEKGERSISGSATVLSCWL